MQYKTIFEIGPIFHFVRNSRKTMDVWGGSFLFSYLMGRVAKAIVDISKKDIENIIVRPALKNNPIYTWIAKNKLPEGGITAGSIPDQIYCVHDNATLPQDVHGEFISFLEKIFNNCAERLKKDNIIEYSYKKETADLVKDQLTNYFRLFYVTAESQESDNWDELEKAIASRGRIYDFEDSNDTVNSVDIKKEKCSLCGDYKNVVRIKYRLRGNKEENLCAVCTIKRGLLKQLKDEIKCKKFVSTTAIGAQVVKNILKDNYDTIKDSIDTFIKEFEKLNSKKEDEKPVNIDEEFSMFDKVSLEKTKGTKEVINALPYEFYFSDNPASVNFRKAIKEKCKIELDDRVWIDSGYFAIVYIDGDDTGEFFKTVDEEGSKKISEAIAEYASLAEKIVKKNGEKNDEKSAQLIYSGGEDTLFICHPRDVFKIIRLFSDKFQEKLQKEVDKETKLSVSAGVYICPHKHPLKLALKGADDLLQEAKKIPGKGSVKINLVKGTGEVNKSFFSIQKIYSVDDFLQLIEAYQKKDISRSFVFKLKEEMHVYSEILSNKQQVEDYVQEIFSKTHPKNVTFNENMKTLIEQSTDINEEKIDYSQLVERLYFARFLTGGE